MSDTRSHEAQVEALGDMYDALERYAGTDGATDTGVARDRLWAATRALFALAVRSDVPQVADACLTLEKTHGL